MEAPSSRLRGRCVAQQQRPDAASVRRGRLRRCDRVALVRLWYRCDGNVRRVLSLWRRSNEEADVAPQQRRRSVCARTVLATVRRFEESGDVSDRARCGRRRSVRIDETIDLVRDSVRGEPMLSTRKRAKRLGVSRSSLMRIQKLDLRVRAYKVQMAQRLLPADAANRLALSERILREHARDRTFVHRLIMGDEAHFDLTGGVFNRQNVRFWGTQNPRLVRPKAAHGVRVTVWCGVSSTGVLGPYFFEEGVRCVSVTGERYRRMLREYVAPRLRNARRGSDDDPRRDDGGWWWWQQDGATAHTARDTIALLRRMFGADRVISRGAATPWPARSPDLSAADYFLWGYLKDRVYDGAYERVDPPVGGDDDTTVSRLKRAIVREIAKLNGRGGRALRRAVMESLVARASACVRERGGHLRDVVFHT